MSAGPATCCTARTATATRSATARSASSAAPPDAVRYAQIVRQWTHDVVFFAPPASSPRPSAPSWSPAPSASSRAPSTSWSSTTTTACAASQLADGRVIPRDALFVPPRFVPNNDLLVGLGCDLDENGWVRVDPTGRTSVPGVWAAGNLVDPRAQVITAAGDGSAAAIAINADLVDDDVRQRRPRLPPRRPRLTDNRQRTSPPATFDPPNFATRYPNPNET